MMFNFRKLLRVGFLTILIAAVSFTYISTPKVHADELSDLNAQIQQKQKEKDETLGKIKSIESNIKSILSVQSDLNSKLNALKSEQGKLLTQIANLDSQNAEQEKILQDYLDRLKEKEKIIDETTNYLFKLSFMNAFATTDIWSEKTDTEKQDIFLDTAKTNLSIEFYKSEIKSYEAKINEANKIKEQIEKDKQTVLASKTQLDTQIADLNKQLGVAKKDLADANKVKSGLVSRTNIISQQLDLLSAQQRELLVQEEKLISSNPNSSNKVIGPGELYFYGTGNDSKQGHGVGMSQYGAYGGGQKGMSASDILTFYYTGTVVTSFRNYTSNDRINVQGHGNMNINDYAAGIGEIPDRACGTQAQIDAWNAYANSQGWPAGDARRNKFTIDNTSTMWDCWPEETIKAQVIAARSYAMSNYALKGGTICTTAACQVYKGGQAKKWASEATKDLIVAYNGKIINALYSSDNNQGFGTANNDTVWSSNSGVGTVYPYLRAKNDSAFAFRTAEGKREWNTSGYNGMADIQKLLQHMAGNSSYSSSNFFKGVLNDVGEVKSIQLTKDPSKRVKYVTINGTKGSRNVAGWLFKASWNNFTCKVGRQGKPACDYILSLTYDFSVK